jgi:transglutaminase-like putative cysteine protease
MNSESTSNLLFPIRKLSDGPAFAFLIIALLTATRRLYITNWTDHLGFIQAVAFYGGIVGLSLGFSLFNGRKSFLLGSAYGLLIIPWQLLQTMDLRIEWKERFVSLLGRFLFTLEQIFNSQVVIDPILFWMTMSVLFWVISTTAGYTLARTSQPWRAVLPAGLIMVIIQTYDNFVGVRIWYLALFILLIIMLVSRIFFINQQHIWKQQKTHTPIYASFDLLKVTFTAGLIIVFVAWIIPPLTQSITSAEDVWLQITKPFNNVKEDITNAFSSLQVASSETTDYYGDNLALGRGNTLSNDIVLEIITPIKPASNIRLYWRARVYDYFDPQDRGWEITNASTKTISPDNPTLNIPLLDSRWNAEFIVTVGSPLSILYTALQPISVSRPADFKVSQNTPDETDISYIRAEEVLHTGESYSFVAQITNASIFELRRAGKDYPSWVLDKYLQVPDSITERTIALAHEIRGTYTNPYDITHAVTQYLRENITYAEEVPNLPNNQDPIDWMLFDLEEGFCNYYATSEIMLLRILGIPARMAVGFSEGALAEDSDLIARLDGELRPVQFGENEDEGISNRNYYTVRQNNVHAWPEVYFPEIGWVEFEPTTNENEIVRVEQNSISSNNLIAADEEIDLTILPEGIIEEELPQLTDLEDQIDDTRIPLPSWLYFLLFSVVSGFLIFGWQKARHQGLQSFPVLIESGMRRLNIRIPKQLSLWSKFTTLSPFEKSYQEINKALKRIGFPQAQTQTPKERTILLVNQLPEIKVSAELLNDEYQTSIYARENGNLLIAIKNSKIIRKASYIKWAKIQLSKLKKQKYQKGDLAILYKEKRQS